jgi:SAM-dependent methyltransferase
MIRACVLALMPTPTYEPRPLIRRAPRRALTPSVVATHAIASAILGPVCAVRAALRGTPGMRFQIEAANVACRLAMRGRRRALLQAGKMLAFPMDSTRYFEFDWVWERLQQRPTATHYLDVSSPRLLPVRYARQSSVRKAVFINPDASDLEITRECVTAAGIAEKCELHPAAIEQSELGSQQFDVVTSISVLEHIADDRSALRVIWQLIKPGGVLLLTLPCTAVGYDQYRDFNEYNLVPASDEGTYFFQRFYDERALSERIYSIVGRPSSSAVYGERTPGFFIRNAEQKMRGLPYPFWEEPLMMQEHFCTFPSIGELPGEGVVALEFVKASA